MTKKHFEAIAKIINKHLPTELVTEKQEIVNNVLTELAGDLAQYFRSVNPRFDFVKFANACTRKS